MVEGMHGYTVYDDETGRIITSGWVTSLSDVALQSNALGEPMRHIVLEGAFASSEYYVVEHEAVVRPQITPIDEREILADGQHVTSFSNIPEGTQVMILLSTDGGRPKLYGNMLTIDDGELEFVTSVAGYYELHFSSAFPYRDQVVRVTANAP